MEKTGIGRRLVYPTVFLAILALCLLTLMAPAKGREISRSLFTGVLGIGFIPGDRVQTEKTVGAYDTFFQREPSGFPGTARLRPDAPSGAVLENGGWIPHNDQTRLAGGNR